MSGSSYSAVSDRRLLLRYILQNLINRGTQVILPVGCTGFEEDWLLDSLDVPRLIQLASDLRNKIDLISLCTSRQGSINIENSFSSLKLVYSEDANPEDVINERTPLPKLHTNSSAWLQDADEQPLQQLAFLIFLQSCGSQSSSNLLQSVRGQLEITEASSQELSRVTSLSSNAGITSFSTADALVKALQTVPPSSFQSFRSYAAWRSAMSTIIRGCVEESVKTSWISSSSKTLNPTLIEPSVEGHYLLATLKGNLRRLDVRDLDEFDAKEHANAVDAVSTAVQHLTARCTAGTALPWPVRVKLAELLLQGVFDSLDEGSFSPDANELLQLLQSVVWPQLGISTVAHQSLFVWVHFRQYVTSQQPSLLESSITMLRTMSETAASAHDNTRVAAADAQLSRNVLESLKRECLGALSDYHRLGGGVEEIRCLLSLLQHVWSALRQTDEGLSSLVSTCIAASVEKLFTRKATELEKNVSVEEDRVALLATETREMLRIECNDISMVFRPMQPLAPAIAAAALHRSFGATLLPWLINVTTLTKSVVATVRASLSLEGDLLAETDGLPSLQNVDAVAVDQRSGGGGGGGMSPAAAASSNDAIQATTRPVPWGAMEKVGPLMYTWAQGQLSILQGWLTRIVGKDDWLDVAGKARGAAARSAAEAAKVASDTVDALFGMELEIPPGVVRCLVEGMDGILQKYCEAVMSGIGNADCLIPPAPPLTRYKQDIVVNAELQELHDSASGGGGGSGGATNGAMVMTMQDSSLSSGTSGAKGKLKAVTTRVSAAFSAQWLPAPTSDEQQRVLTTSYAALVVRANSLFRLVQHSIASLERIIVQKWDAGRVGSDDQGVLKKSLSSSQGRHQSAREAFSWVAGMFDGTKAAAADGIDRLLHFAAVKFICGDLRVPIFERLYKFHVEPHRIRPILEHVDTMLGMLCETLHEDLAARLAGHVCKTLSAAVTHVLVDGGPHRWFVVDDARLLQDDVEQLRTMFYAEGAGLDPGAIAHLSQQLMDVVGIMALDTKSLIQALHEAKKKPLGRMVGQPGSTANDSEVILRVLCHRADHAASKYLKKDHKIAKKLPIGLVLSMSKSFHAVLGGNNSTLNTDSRGGGGGGVGMRRAASATTP